MKFLFDHFGKIWLVAAIISLAMGITLFVLVVRVLLRLLEVAI